MVGVVDNDRIGVGYVESTFYDGGGHENIEFAVHKVQHDFLKFLSVHLPVANGDLGIRNEALYHPGNLLDVADSIVDEKDLASALNLVADGIAYGLLIEAYDLCFDGLTVRRRSSHDTQVTRGHQGELKGSGDRGCGEGEGVNVDFERLDFVLNGHTELLLLIDDQKAEVLVFHLGTDELVRTDDDINLARF